MSDMPQDSANRTGPPEIAGTGESRFPETLRLSMVPKQKKVSGTVFMPQSRATKPAC
jgi:hypothetical protein